MSYLQKIIIKGRRSYRVYRQKVSQIKFAKLLFRKLLFPKHVCVSAKSFANKVCETFISETFVSETCVCIEALKVLKVKVKFFSNSSELSVFNIFICCPLYIFNKILYPASPGRERGSEGEGGR